MSTKGQLDSTSKVGVFDNKNTASEPRLVNLIYQTEKYEQEVTIEVEEDAKAENEKDVINQSVLDIHKANVKEEVDLAITQFFFAILIRSLASLAWYLSAFVLAEKVYKSAIIYPLVISEACIICLTLLFGKSKNKRCLPTLIDLTKIIESAIIITCCLLNNYHNYFLAGYISLTFISWKFLLCKFLNTINETFSIRIVEYYKLEPFIH